MKILGTRARARLNLLVIFVNLMSFSVAGVAQGPSGGAQTPAGDSDSAENDPIGKTYDVGCPVGPPKNPRKLICVDSGEGVACDATITTTPSGPVGKDCEKARGNAVTEAQTRCETVCDAHTSLPNITQSYSECMSATGYRIQGTLMDCRAIDLDPSGQSTANKSCIAALKAMGPPAKTCNSTCEKEAKACAKVGEASLALTGELDSEDKVKKSNSHKKGEKKKLAEQTEAEEQINNAAGCAAASQGNRDTVKKLMDDKEAQHDLDVTTLAAAEESQRKSETARSDKTAQMSATLKKMQADAAKLESDLAALPLQTAQKKYQISIGGVDAIQVIKKAQLEIQTSQLAAAKNDSATEAQDILNSCWKDTVTQSQDYIHKLQASNSVMSAIATHPDISSQLTMRAYGSGNSQQNSIRNYFYNQCLAQPNTQGNLATAARKQEVKLTALNTKLEQMNADLKQTQLKLKFALDSADIESNATAKNMMMSSQQMTGQLQDLNKQMQQASDISVEESKADAKKVKEASEKEANDKRALDEYRGLYKLAAGKIKGNAGTAKKSLEYTEIYNDNLKLEQTIQRECCKPRGSSIPGVSQADSARYCKEDRIKSIDDSIKGDQ